MMIRLRPYITASVGLTFAVVGLTGILFQFFFKTKTLEQIHAWLGVAMVVAAIIHIVQNWKSMLNHFRNWRVASLAIPVVIVIAALFAFGSQGTGRGLNPRMMIGKLSQGRAQDVARAFGKEPEAVFAAMNRDGLKIDSTELTLQQIAQQNQKSPDRVLIYFVK